MYCLECGHKIKEGQNECPQCGMSVDEMKKRIAEAQEKVTYAETVGPAETVKLPPVPERVYHDKEGNVIDPKEEIDASVATSKSDELPVIGHAEDPLITMPMQKIVSDDGKVIAAGSDEAKAFVQPPKKKKRFTARTKAIFALFIVFVFVAIAAALLNSAGVLKHTEVTESDQVEQVNNQAVDTQESQQEIQQSDTVKALQESYQALGDYRGQVNAIVSDFNNFHLASDKAKRQSCADACNKLISTVTDAKAKLVEEMNELGMNENDEQFSNYTKINKLYELLLTRLNVIKQCWDVSITSADPKKDSAAILAPLSQDIKGGRSSSMADFDALYPQVDLSKQ